MKKVITLLVIAMVAFGAIGCGSKKDTGGAASSSAQTPGSTSTQPEDKVRFAKTKFLLHAGLAFGAFHRYIYKPIRRGTFASSGKIRKTLILAKGALAGLFAYHELKLAIKDAHSSKLLSKVISPIEAVATRLKNLGSSLRGGKANPTEIQQTNGELSSLGQQSAAAGAPIKDVTPPANLQPAG
jgi:hypothetical protein